MHDETFDEKPAAEVGTDTGITPTQQKNMTLAEWTGVAVGGLLLGVVMALLVTASQVQW